MTLKKVSVFFTIFLVAISLAACAEPVPAPTPGTSAAAPTPIRFTDLTGETIEFATTPQRVIAMDPSQCEIIYALGAGNKLVALGSYCDYPPEAETVKKVGSYSKMNIEEIVALNPDCLLLGTMATDEAQAAAIKNAKIPVVVLNSKTIEDSYVNIGKIGMLLGKDAEAAAVVSSMKAQLDAVKAASAGGKAVSVYYEVSPLSSGPWTCGKATFQHELIEMAGGTNIFADLDGWVKVSEEQIVKLNPDVIITSKHAAQVEDPVAEILGRTGWEAITAVKGKRVYAIDTNIVSRAAPRLADGGTAIRACLDDTAK